MKQLANLPNKQQPRPNPVRGYWSKYQINIKLGERDLVIFPGNVQPRGNQLNDGKHLLERPRKHFAKTFLAIWFIRTSYLYEQPINLLPIIRSCEIFCKTAKQTHRLKHKCLQLQYRDNSLHSKLAIVAATPVMCERIKNSITWLFHFESTKLKRSP